jgi:hypothetical protein
MQVSETVQVLWAGKWVTVLTLEIGNEWGVDSFTEPVIFWKDGLVSLDLDGEIGVVCKEIGDEAEAMRNGVKL